MWRYQSTKIADGRGYKHTVSYQGSKEPSTLAQEIRPYLQHNMASQTDRSRDDASPGAKAFSRVFSLVYEIILKLSAIDLVIHLMA